MVRVVYYRHFGLRPFVSVVLIFFFFFVVSTNGNEERTVDLSEENVIDYFDNYTYNDLCQLLQNTGPLNRLIRSSLDCIQLILSKRGVMRW